MATPSTKVEQMLTTTAEMLHDMDKKTHKKDVSRTSFAPLAENLNSQLIENIKELERANLNANQLRGNIENRISQVLAMITSLNKKRKVIEALGNIQWQSIEKLETILRKFKIGEKVEAKEFDQL